jgi:hypothetical protein
VKKRLAPSQYDTFNFIAHKELERLKITCPDEEQIDIMKEMLLARKGYPPRPIDAQSA